MKKKSAFSLLVAATLFSLTLAQCPWLREIQELQSPCVCNYNLGHEFSVQCDMVDWPILLQTLNKYCTSTPIDILYVNNSTIGALRDNDLSALQIQNIQFSGCKIKSVSKDAFKGLENHLKNLNLQDNDLSEAPIESLRDLRLLSVLDLSHNRITNLPGGAFETLTKLAALKLSDNNVTLENDSLRGLEGSLKNLNLKGTGQKDIPGAIQGMKTLASLDLSHNSLRELPGLDDTKAMNALSELRVLDIGFNLLTELPGDAFKGNPSINILALDGNPLATIPYEALSHLNNTLIGLGLGGRSLHCDCRLAWVIHWIRNGDLHVTSRERNPQFCGSPPRFRDRGFYNIQPEGLSCAKSKNTTSTTTTTTTTTMAP